MSVTIVFCIKFTDQPHGSIFLDTKQYRQREDKPYLSQGVEYCTNHINRDSSRTLQISTTCADDLIDILLKKFL